MTKTLQYELWQECNNHCTYCTLGCNNIKTPKEMKLLAINTAIQELQQLTQGEVSTLGFIGGEFFQGQLYDFDVKRAFFDLMAVANGLLNEGIIEELWLNVTLTIGENVDLYDLIASIDRKDKLWLLTSYDTKGRFHTDKMFDTWSRHMEELKDFFPEVRRNTTMIITGDFIQKYLKDEIDLHEFEHKYNTSVFLKTPVKPDDLCNMSKGDINKKFGYYFFPKEIDFTKFLMKFREKEGIEAFDKLFSNSLKAEELHKNYNDNELRNVIFTRSADYKEHLDCDKSLKDIEESKCGHSSIYKCFVDTDGCAICCKQLIATL